MSLTVIKTQLYTLEAAVTGVNRAYLDLPDLAPSPPDLPAILNARGEPPLEISNISAGVVRYDWNFNILFLLKVAGMGTIEEWDDDIEPFPRRLIEKFLSSFTLDGNVVDQRLRATARIGVNITYLDTTYFGFVLPWTVTEDIVTAVTP